LISETLEGDAIEKFHKHLETGSLREKRFEQEDRVRAG